MGGATPGKTHLQYGVILPQGQGFDDGIMIQLRAAANQR